MIPSEIDELVTRRSALELEDRRKVFARDIAVLHAQLSMQGALRSGRMVVQVQDMVRREYRVRASIIWQTSARAFDAARAPIPKDADEILSVIEKLLIEGSSDLPTKLKSSAEIAGGSRTADITPDAIREAMDRIGTEVRFAQLKQTGPADGESGSSVVNVYQSYGIVQTGSHSTANLSINLGADERSEIAAALDAIQEVLDSTPAGIDPSSVAQSRELIDDARRELNRDEPNPHRLRGSLQGLALIIQTSAAAPHAYALLKGAAAMVGLTLP